VLHVVHTPFDVDNYRSVNGIYGQGHILST
jgi:hypothetical protein